jgi:hypothetical protein
MTTGKGPKAPLSQDGGIKTFGTWNAGEAQPDWSMTVDGRGLLEGNFKKHYPSQQNVGDTIPQKGSGHPMDKRLTCYKSSANFGKMGQLFVTAEYIGLAKDPTEAEWELSSSTSSSSIVFHPAFPDMAMQLKPTAANKGNYKFYPYVDHDPSNPKVFVRFNCATAPYGLAGVESYLIPKGTVKVSFYTAKKAMVSEVLSNLGHTSGAPLYVPTEVLATTGGNYLLTNASATEYGNVYKLSMEWMCSEHGEPWNPLIYQAYGAGPKKRKGFLDPSAAIQTSPMTKLGYPFGGSWST